MNDSHIIDREMILDYEHPVAGPMKTLGFPAKFSLTPGELKLPAPLLEQNNQEVMQELGYNIKKIDQFKNDGVIN